MRTRLWAKASMIALAAAALPTLAAAQDGEDVVLVTGTKKAQAENVQDVPLAVTAYGEAQLDQLKVRDLGNLSYKIPNVQLEDIGTSRGVANFSIRGLAINSSIPSIDPAVGLFVDGIYQGQNGGQVLDIFDMESVEVLRGPQGILFGRNVTGGAVLINTTRPNLNEFEAKFKGAVETGFRSTGLNYYAMGSVSGPLIEDVLAVKIAAYYNNDDGWHDRDLPGPGRAAFAAGFGGTVGFLQGVGYPIGVDTAAGSVNFGEAETWMVRGAVLFAPTDNVELLVRYEHGDSSGDGPASQNHPGFFQPACCAGFPFPPVPVSNVFYSAPKDSFTFSIDEPGFYEFVWDAVTAELNIDVGFGEGRITNVFGWRSTDGETRSDIDATPFWLFHAGSTSEYKQISNEIRYAGRFVDMIDLVVGFYYFNSDNDYEERRHILGGFRDLIGGGLQDSRQYAAFGNLEIDLSDTFSVIGGVRYTNEKKTVELVNITANLFTNPPLGAGGSCSVFAHTCLGSPAPFPVFMGSDTWENITPSAGIQWTPREDLNVYAKWTEGVRSGGFNFRNTSIIVPFNSFDEEEVDTYELGIKAQPADGRLTLNAAVFRTDIDGMQREINIPDPFAGVVQLIFNTADATIFGVELEALYQVTDNFVVRGNLGHLDGSYDDGTVVFDLNSDGFINAFDETLQIPRLAKWSWGAGFVHTLDLGDFGVVTRFDYAHRDDNAYTDNNLGILQGAEIIDATIGLNIHDRATISIYGQNLLNEVTHGGETQLPLTLGGGTFAPLNKGRIVGVELQVEI